MSKKENAYQAALKKRLKNEFPGCIVMKNDPNDIQGIPDLLVLYEDKWAALEVKKTKNAHHRPNQDYYIDKMNDMSYATFVYPENEEEVFNGLQQTFKPRRSTRTVRSK